MNELHVLQGRCGHMCGDTAGLVPGDFSNIELGLYALHRFAEVFPGLKFGDLPVIAARYKELDELNGRMGKKEKCSWWDALCKSRNLAIDVKRGVGSVISDTADFIGRKGGEFVRLFSDDDVQNAVKNYASLAATKGGSATAESILDRMFGKDGGDKAASFLDDLGGGLKKIFGMDGEGGGAAKTWGTVALVGGGALAVYALSKGMG